MAYYQCKCGNVRAWGSMGPWPCQKCDKCGSDLAAHPDFHSDPKPHDFITDMVDTDSGPQPFTRCRWCGLSATADAERGAADQAAAPRWCPAPFRVDDGTVADCLRKGHCGCDERAAADQAAAPRQHMASADCWCNPAVDYVDPDTGVTVYVHNEPN